MNDPEPLPEPVRPARQSSGDRLDASTGNAALVILAVVAMGAVVTVLGPVLKPFLVALFLFYATQFVAKSFSRLGMQPWTAYLALISLALIFTILTAQLVYREAEVFQRTWPRYEDRIAASLAMWMPQLAAAPSPAARSPSESEEQPPSAVASPSGTLAPQSPAGGLSTPAAGNAATIEADEQAPQGEAEEKLPEQTEDLFGATETTGVGTEPASAPGSKGSDEAVFSPSPKVGGSRGRNSLPDLFRITSQDVLKYVFSHSLDVAELIVVVFCYLVFLFLGSRKLKARVLRAFPGDRSARLVAIGDGITESMERFMVVKTLAGVGMAVSAAVIMHGFGLDHWMLWAFLFFALNYITYIGSAAACVPPVVMALLDLDSHMMALLLSALIVLNRIFWIDFFELRLSGKQLNLDPTLLFLWLSYWGWAWGILGLILAYPMLAALRIALEHIGGLGGWAVLLSDE
jgi:predicted PurR-regulated permease PerM